MRTRPMVLLVCAVNGHGGPIASIATVVRLLRPEIDFWLATQIHESPERKTSIEFLVSNTIHIPRPLGCDGFRAAWLLLKRWRWAKRELTAIHANGLTEAIIALPLALASRVHVVVWVHNSKKPRPYRLLEGLVQIVGRRWTWRPVSSVAAKLINGLRFTVLPNPVDSSVVAPARTTSSELRVLYFAGSDRVTKGFDLLPAIIRGTRTRGVRWIIYAGPTDVSKDVVRAQAWQELIGDLSDRVDIRPRTQDPREAYGDADLVLAPSRAESFNRVIAEGIVNGLPFIASDIPAHVDLARSTGAGLLFSLADPERAGRLVDGLIREPERFLALRRASVESSLRFDARPIAFQLARDWQD